MDNKYIGNKYSWVKFAYIGDVITKSRVPMPVPTRTSLISSKYSGWGAAHIHLHTNDDMSIHLRLTLQSGVRAVFILHFISTRI